MSMTTEQYAAMVTGRAKAKGRTARRQPGTMNKTEAAYGDHLDARYAAGEVLWWRFEGVTLKLAKDLRWTPDFVVQVADGTIELHDVKGHWEDHSRAKILTTGQMFPFVVRVVRKTNAGWEAEEVGA